MKSTKRTTRTTKTTDFTRLTKAAIAKAESLRDNALEGIGEARARTTGAVNQLERAFEQRVSKAASRLGFTTSKEVRALSRQVAELQAAIAKIRRPRARA